MELNLGSTYLPTYLVGLRPKCSKAANKVKNSKLLEIEDPPRPNVCYIVHKEIQADLNQQHTTKDTSLNEAYLPDSDGVRLLLLLLPPLPLPSLQGCYSLQRPRPLVAT